MSPFQGFPSICAAGDMFYISDRTHTLHFLVRFLILVLFFVLSQPPRRWECGNPWFWDFHIPIVLIIGLPIFLPKSFHLQLVGVETSDRYSGKVHAVVAIIDRQQADALPI